MNISTLDITAICIVTNSANIAVIGMGGISPSWAEETMRNTNQ